MTITLDLPENLVNDVMKCTNATSQSDGIRIGLENMLRREENLRFAERFGGVDNFDLESASKAVDSSELVNYFGKIDFREGLDLDALRGRNDANW